MGETSEEEPTLYGWFTTDPTGRRHYFEGGSTTPFREPAKPSKPMTIRMFVDDVSGIALWPDLAWAYPGSPFEHLFEAKQLEDALPIPDALRGDIRSWVDEYTESIGARRSAAWGIDHDRRGRWLSEQLQEALAEDDFRVVYRPHTRVVRRENQAP